MSTTAFVSSSPAPAPAPGAGPAAAAEAPPPRFDFPTWLSPMLVKELRQGLRQRGFVAGLLGVQLVLLFVFVTGFVSDVGDRSSRGMIDGVFWSVMFGLLLIGTPLRALTALSSELEARTMDLLLLTRLDARRIVWSKWVSIMVQALLVVVTLLPYAVVRYFFGSVDLVADFRTIGIFVGCGAVLTALGLWMSGLHRALRLLVVIGVVVVSITGFGGIMGGGLRHGFSLSGGPSPWLVWPLLSLGGAVLLVYFLMLAVRWFAPPAENHAVGPRLVPFALALPAPIIGLAGYPDGAAIYGLFWAAALAVIAALELSSTRDLMAIHLRGAARSGVRRILSPAFLPGWPSATLWLAGLCGLFVVYWGLIDAMTAEDWKFGRVPWMVILGWTGLVFPALLVSLLPTAARVSGVIYFALHALLGIFAVMAGSDGLSHMAPLPMRVMDWLTHALPTTSFWHALVELKRPSDLPALELGQALGVAVTLAMMLIMARPYWRNVRWMREQAAAIAAEGENEREAGAVAVAGAAEATKQG